MSQPPVGSTPLIQTLPMQERHQLTQFRLDKIARSYATNMTNRFYNTTYGFTIAEWKIARTREPRSIPIIVRLITEQI